MEVAEELYEEEETLEEKEEHIKRAGWYVLLGDNSLAMNTVKIINTPPLKSSLVQP